MAVEVKTSLPPFPSAAPDAAEAAVSSSPLSPESNAEKPKQSIGEKAAWWATYGGGYLVTLGVSVALWDFLMERRGRVLYDAVAKGLGHGFGTMGMKPEAAQKLANTTTKMACSPLGGHFTSLFPQGYMEQHYRHIAHACNKVLDPNYQYKDLQVSWNSPNDQLPVLTDEPSEQKWYEIAARRLLISWPVVTLSGVALNKVGWEKPLENGTLRVFDKAVELTGSKSLQNFMKKPMPQSYAKLTALDSYFTVITTGIAYATNNMFGKKSGEKETPEEAATHRIDAAAPADTPSSTVLVHAAQPQRTPTALGLTA